MIAPLKVVSLDVGEPNIKEIRRYIGCKEGLDKQIKEVLFEADDLTYRVAYLEFPLKICDDFLDLGFIKIKSKDLQKALHDADKIILFCATIGILPDKMIKKYSKISPTKALVWQGVGAERVEALCDAFCEKMKANYNTVYPRFSPGYGDLSLDIQKDILNILSANIKLGITLSDSLLMTPTKTVTAIMGAK